MSEVRAAIARVAAPVMAARVRSVLSVDVRETLSAAEAPLLSICALHDRLLGVWGVHAALDGAPPRARTTMLAFGMSSTLRPERAPRQ